MTDWGALARALCNPIKCLWQMSFISCLPKHHGLYIKALADQTGVEYGTYDVATGYEIPRGRASCYEEAEGAVYRQMQYGHYQDVKITGLLEDDLGARGNYRIVWFLNQLVLRQVK